MPACLFFCIIFATLSWSAVSDKSATSDEPEHSAVGWLMLYRHDFRLSPDVPPLWEDWVALAIGPGAIHYDWQAPEYRNLRAQGRTWSWETHALYQTPGNDGVAIVRRGRIMALAVGVALLILIGWWAWSLAGAAAGAAAMFVFALDPNFLGHAPLVKNDVPATLAYLAAAYAIFLAGRRISLLTALAVMLAVAACILIKFSGLLLAPVMALALAWRALSKHPWTILGRTVHDRLLKLSAASTLLVASGLFTWAAIWAMYDFRFAAGPDGLQLDTDQFVQVLREVEIFDRTHREPTPTELAAWRPPLATRAALFALDHQLVPQAWAGGFLKTQEGAASRLCFLNGLFYNGGKWYYFPLAALYKAPLATIVAVILAGWMGLRLVRRGLLADWNHRWAAVALFVPALVYGAVAVTSNINIGLRHAFPIYPFVYIGVGLAAARLWQSGALARALVVLLALGLATETAAAYPNYINFFGVASGGPKAGFDLLSDSNLDWGQDLPALAQWQAKHADLPLYLDYFGRCDPAAYRIRYFNLQKVQGPSDFGPPPVMPDQAGVIAVSATDLHLVAAADPPPPWYRLIAGKKPDEILCGTIYLFRIGSPKPDLR